MIDLIKFFFDNIEERSPYKKYFESIKRFDQETSSDRNIMGFSVMITSSTDDDVIERIKSLCMPTSFHSEEEMIEFILLCFYLNEKGYYIEQFPNQLSNPKNLMEFSYYEIRNYLISLGKDEAGTVRWAVRRTAVNALSFKHKNGFHHVVHDGLNDAFVKISTRQASFSEMSDQEKIEQISNLIENKLKVGNQFLELDTANTANLLSNENLLQYRKLTQCYRHATVESLAEREQYKNQEQFLIYYGLAFLYAIFEKK